MTAIRSMLAIVMLSITATGAAADEQRIAAGTPRMFSPNFVFGFQKRLRHPAILAQLGTQIAETTRKHPSAGAAIVRFSDAVSASLSAHDTDALARYVATSYESTLSIIIQLQFLRMLSVDNPAIMNSVESAKVDLHDLDGETHALPVVVAALAHSSALHLVDLEMRERPASVRVDGRYTVDGAGACPPLPTMVELKQRAFAIEGLGLGEAATNGLELYGAVGANRLYLVTNEQRFARIRTDKDGAKIDVPDEPSDMFEGSVPADSGPLTLTSVVRRACVLTLSPAA